MVVNENSQRFSLTDSGWIPVTDSSDWVNQATPVTNALVARIPTIDKFISGFDYLKAKGQTTIYLLKDGALRATYNAEDRAALTVGMGDPWVLTIAPSGLDLIPKSVMILPKGVVVRNKKTSQVGIIDGGSRMVTIGSASMQLNLPTPRDLSPLQLVGYGDTQELGSYKLRCRGSIYIVADTKLFLVDPSLAKDYPGRATNLSAETCALLDTDITGRSFGRYVGVKTKDPLTMKTKYKTYKVIKGKKLPFKNLGELKAENLTGAKITWVSQSFLDNLPLRSEAVIAGNPGVPELQPKSYTIVSGDSLSSIAIRFKTTVQILMQLNAITNANRISIGQVIKLP